MKSATDSVARFTAFYALLSVAANGASESGAMELNVDDVLYFNLAGADVGDGE